MSLLQGTHIAVWFEDGLPLRIVYNGTRYQVTDEPTRLEDEMAMLTHPLPVSGWRFQGTDSMNGSRVFDIRQDGDDWIVIGLYE